MIAQGLGGVCFDSGDGRCTLYDQRLLIYDPILGKRNFGLPSTLDVASVPLAPRGEGLRGIGARDWSCV